MALIATSRVGRWSLLVAFLKVLDAKAKNKLFKNRAKKPPG
jgi:hypothetical protein